MKQVTENQLRVANNLCICCSVSCAAVLFCGTSPKQGAALFVCFGGCWIDLILYSHSTNTSLNWLRCEDLEALSSSCLGSLIKIQLSFWFLITKWGHSWKRGWFNFFPAPLPYLLRCRDTVCQFTHIHSKIQEGLFAQYRHFPRHSELVFEF